LQVDDFPVTCALLSHCLNHHVMLSDDGFFGGRLRRQQAQSSIVNFENDLRDGIFQIRGLSDEVFERARQLSRQTTPKLGTRAADLLHVAAALEFGATHLYSFNQRQRKLARAVRFKLN
jgi:hypothetical protein